MNELSGLLVICSFKKLLEALKGCNPFRHAFAIVRDCLSLGHEPIWVSVLELPSGNRIHEKQMVLKDDLLIYPVYWPPMNEVCGARIYDRSD